MPVTRRFALNATAAAGSVAAVATLLALGALGYAHCSRPARADTPGAGSVAPSVATPAQSAPTAPSAFKDVPANHWAASSVNALAAKRIVKGEPKNAQQSAYDGNKFVTRYEAAVLLDRFAKSIEQARQPLHAELVPDSKMPALPPSWAQAAQRDLVASNYLPKTSPLLQGSGNAPVTAAEFSAALAQVVVRISDRNMPLTPNAADFDDEDLGK